ncbi:MAG: hypothetical protein U0791_24300 [Gemmataceae bacterium]
MSTSAEFASPKFTDRLGREWQVEVSVDLLPSLADLGLNFKPDADHTEFASRMLIDPLLAGEVLWIFCAAQAKDRGIDHHGFASGLNADAICAGTDAFAFAIAKFGLLRSLRSQREIEYEKLVTDLNAVRAKCGLPPLNPDGTRPTLASSPTTWRMPASV